MLWKLDSEKILKAALILEVALIISTLVIDIIFIMLVPPEKGNRHISFGRPINLWMLLILPINLIILLYAGYSAAKKYGMNVISISTAGLIAGMIYGFSLYYNMILIGSGYGLIMLFSYPLSMFMIVADPRLVVGLVIAFSSAVLTLIGGSIAQKTETKESKTTTNKKTKRRQLKSK